jgi:hypothetical protein
MFIYIIYRILLIFGCTQSALNTLFLAAAINQTPDPLPTPTPQTKRYTQCRNTYGAPTDPRVVLGGFPAGPEFRNYSSDATALVVTYPVDPSLDARAAAVAWEQAFIELARGELSQMAAAANLTLAFSAERCALVCARVRVCELRG